MILRTLSTRATLTLLPIALLMVACAAPSSLPPAHVETLPVGQTIPAALTTSLRVVSLNAAHSRSMGIHQGLQSSATARDNLDAVAALISRENADVVALQEIDGPSAWSGGFDHVAYLAQEVGLSSTVRGTHMKSPGLDYGTALLAKYPLSDPLSVPFGHAFSLTRKGFVVSSIQWPGALDTTVDVVSLHLHPFRAGARARQVEELVEILQQRGRPVIVMGDFNDDWRKEDTAARALGNALGLSAYEFECDKCHTHRRMKNFVDWVLISPELQFETFEVLNDDVSDHYAIAATVSLRPQPTFADQSL